MHWISKSLTLFKAAPIILVPKGQGVLETKHFVQSLKAKVYLFRMATHKRRGVRCDELYKWGYRVRCLSSKAFSFALTVLQGGIMGHIKANLPTVMDSFQFAYCSNHSTDDVIFFTRTFKLSDTTWTVRTRARILFVDFSSAFSYKHPIVTVDKISLLYFSTSLCKWIVDFVSDRPQTNSNILPPRAVCLIHCYMPQEDMAWPFPTTHEPHMNNPP